jgi:hypothetical protein
MLNPLKKQDTNAEILLKMPFHAFITHGFYLLYQRVGKRKFVVAHYRFHLAWRGVLSSETRV